MIENIWGGSIYIFVSIIFLAIALLAYSELRDIRLLLEKYLDQQVDK